MAKEMIRRLIVPVAVAAAVMFFFQPVYHPAGKEIDYLLMLLLIGIPFGIQKMFVWFIPSGHDLCGMVGLVVFNILIGGIIGTFVFFWRIVTGMIFLSLCVIQLIGKITYKREA